MKKVLIVILVLVLLLVGAALLLLGNLDGIVKKQIEAIGTELTGVPVSVGSVALDLKSGTGQISDLRIGNPDGYKAANAFDMKTLRIGIDVGSIMKQPLVLTEVIIDSPVANMEVAESGASNLKDILDNVSANTAKADEKAPAAKAPKEDGDTKADGQPMRIRIDKLLINGVTFNIDTPLEEETRSGTLPTIDRSNIGGSKGATPGEIGKIVIGDLSKQIIKQSAEKKLMETITEKADGLLKGISDAISKDAADTP